MGISTENLGNPDVTNNNLSQNIAYIKAHVCSVQTVRGVLQVNKYFFSTKCKGNECVTTAFIRFRFIAFADTTPNLLTIPHLSKVIQ